jgi:predicted HTH domain antitoxin
MKATKTRRVEVELPSEAFAHHPWEPDQLSQELRELWLLEQVRQRRLAFTKAAELSGVPLELFLDRMGAHRITPFDLDPDEVARELQ